MNTFNEFSFHIVLVEENTAIDGPSLSRGTCSSTHELSVWTSPDTAVEIRMKNAGFIMRRKCYRTSPQGICVQIVRVSV